MKSFAPCLVVMLAGLALGVASGFAWITGDAYTGEHVNAIQGPALVAAPAKRLPAVPLPPGTGFVLVARGGEAT